MTAVDRWIGRLSIAVLLAALGACKHACDARADALRSRVARGDLHMGPDAD